MDEAGDEPGRLVPLLVMTSGNVHDEPICIADEEARAKLAGIADAFLGNNRPILTRFDDSVVRLIQVDEVDEKPVCAIQFLRRARGYAPVPVSVTAEGVAPAEGIIFAARPRAEEYLHAAARHRWLRVPAHRRRGKRRDLRCVAGHKGSL